MNLQKGSFMATNIRLDKFLCDMDFGTRSEVKAIIKKGLVTVNESICKVPEYKIDPHNDTIVCQGKLCEYETFHYYMLHKPAGFITATTDDTAPTVMELLGDSNRKDLFPVGRLDKDTEGLLLITNNGALAHKLLSPKKHVPKTYLVKIPESLSMCQIEALEQGLDIGDDKLTLPAKLEVVDDTTIHLTITEGRFHQVKRMLLAVGSEVLYLKRLTFGPLILDENLPKGAYRKLNKEEIECLQT